MLFKKTKTKKKHNKWGIFKLALHLTANTCDCLLMTYSVTNTGNVGRTDNLLSSVWTQLQVSPELQFNISKKMTKTTHWVCVCVPMCVFPYHWNMHIKKNKPWAFNTTLCISLISNKINNPVKCCSYSTMTTLLYLKAWWTAFSTENAKEFS